MTLRTFFSAGPVDRNGDARKNPVGLDTLLDHADTRFIAIWQSRCMIADDKPVLLKRAELGAGWQRSHAIYLGQLDESHLFAVALSDSLPMHGPDAAAFDNHGRLLTLGNENDGALLAYAKGMIEWQQRHLYCGHCGAPCRAEEGGFVMVCSADSAHRAFPRVDPAVIVLVSDSDACLLGRQARWPEGRFSTIAGFAEPGESLEDAVRREVAEETNVQVGNVTYLGSQPWPFPQAMMVGFHATAVKGGTDIRLNDQELAEAAWFTREDIAKGSNRCAIS